MVKPIPEKALRVLSPPLVPREAMPPSPRPSARPRISRRTLVKRGIAVGAVATAAAGGVITWGHGRRYPDPDPACPLHYLERREFAIVSALSDALFPADNNIGLSGTEARVPEYVDRMLAGMGSDKAGEFRAMLLLFEHGTNTEASAAPQDRRGFRVDAATPRAKCD